MTRSRHAPRAVALVAALCVPVLTVGFAVAEGVADEGASEGAPWETLFADTVEVATGAGVDAAGEPPAIGDGSWTLVMAWSRTCHVCEVQKADVQALHADDNGVRVVGLALDGRDAWLATRAAEARAGTTFPSWSADLDAAGAAWSAVAREPLRGTPSYLLYDGVGALRAVQAGLLGTDAVLAFVRRAEGES